MQLVKDRGNGTDEKTLEKVGRSDTKRVDNFYFR